VEQNMDIKTIPGVLACDVGNTAIHLAYVKDDDVTPMRSLRVGELSTLGAELSALWKEIPPPRKLVACSVNPTALKALEAAATEAIGEPVLVIGRDLPLPIDTNLPASSATGTDRLCAAAAAFDRLGVACVVADFGTAITIDCVNDEGVFQGGAILPGLDMAAKSLQAGTSQLPLVELSNPDWVFGKDTRQAIVGGLVFAARGALRELVEAYATALGHWPIVILTGGDASLVCGEVNDSGLVQAIVPDLVLRGVAAAYHRSLLK
jgi:type III pantothenate kinase